MSEKFESLFGIYAIDTKMNDLDRYNACYIMDCGGKTVMVDCGRPANWARDTRPAIIERGFDPAKIDYLFITHEHLDHYGASGYICDLNPDVYIGCGVMCAVNLLDDSIEQAERKTVYTSEARRLSSGRPAHVPAKNIHLFEEDQIINVNGHVFKIYLTPGHRKGCCSIHYLNKNVLFCSDLVGNCFSDCDSQYSLCGNGCQYVDMVDSLRKLKGKRASYLALGHFGFSDKPDEVIQGGIDIYQGLLDKAKAIMEADQTEAQTQKLIDMYWESNMSALERARDSSAVGRGQPLFDYAVNEHIPPQAKRFAGMCQKEYFPELAPKK